MQKSKKIQKTRFTCSCNQYLSSFKFSSWLSIEFGGRCAASFNELQLRSKLALWINEECAIGGLRCGKAGNIPFLQPSNILLIGFCLGSIGCVQGNSSVLHLNVVYNTSASMHDSNRVELDLVKAVVQSREHLLTTLLQNHIHSVHSTLTSSLFYSLSLPPSPPLWHYLVYSLCALLSSFWVSTSLLFCLIAGFLNWGISWSKLSRGDWIRAADKPKGPSLTEEIALEEMH